MACDCDDKTSPADSSTASDTQTTDVPGDTPADTPSDVPAAPPSLQMASTLMFASEAAADVQSIALSPDGNTLVATGWDRRVIFFDLATGTGREVHQLGSGDNLEEHAAAWSGAQVAIGSFSELNVFGADGSHTGTVAGRANDVAPIEGGFVRAGRSDVTFVGADLSEGRTTEVLFLDRISRATGGLFVTAGEVDKELIELDPATFTERGRVSFPIGEVFGGGSYNVAPVYDEVAVFNGRTDEGRMSAPAATSDYVALSVAGTWAAATTSGQVILFDLATKTALASAAVATTGPVVLDGQSRLFVGTGTGVQIYDIVRQ